MRKIVGINANRVEAHEAKQRVAAVGSLSEFERLYAAHVDLVYGIALRILRDPVIAEDVTQTVFVKLLLAPETFRIRNFAGWIARVTRNCAIDELRGNHRNAPLLDYAIDCQNGHIEDLAIAQIEATLACRLLDLLPAKQREAIELAFFAGLSHQQIATKIGVPLGTVKARIRAALASIRKALADRRMP